MTMTIVGMNYEDPKFIKIMNSNKKARENVFMEIPAEPTKRKNGKEEK